MKKFLLRLDDNMYDQVSQIAEHKNMSINKYITSVIELKLSEESMTFENRNIIGQLIKGSNIIANKNLIEIFGIYYRYEMADNKTDKAIKDDDFFRIIKTNGNVITIKKEENV